MRTRNRYSVKSSPEIVSLLEKVGVSYKLSTLFDPSIIIFHLYDDDIRKEQIESQLTDWNMIVPELIFSKSEYANAARYRFMPKYDKVPSCDDSLTYSCFCKKSDGTIDYDSTHMHQTGYYRLNKAPRWSSEKCIFSAEGDYNQTWFTNNETRLFLDCSDIQGLRFDPVISNRTGQPLENIYQIVFDYSVPEEALVLEKEYGIKSVVPCESCGEKRYYVSPQTYQLCLHKDYLGDKDIYMTQAVFGQGYGYRMVIGSPKFYQIIKDGALDKFFKIHPVKVITS